MVLSFQWQKVTQTNIPHPSHAFVCNSGHQAVSFSLLFNPIPTVALFSPLVSAVVTPSPASLQWIIGEIVCKYQYKRLCTLSVPLEKWPGQPSLMFTFLRCSRADWFLCWLCSDERKRVDHKSVLKREREQQTSAQRCCREMLMLYLRGKGSV